MVDHTIELVYFDGCPNAEEARESLRAATGSTAEDDAWTEWNLSDDATPARFRRFGSPTVLVDGENVAGSGGENAAMACRSDGAPGPEVIRRALSG